MDARQGILNKDIIGRELSKAVPGDEVAMGPGLRSRSIWATLAAPNSASLKRSKWLPSYRALNLRQEVSNFQYSQMNNERFILTPRASLHRRDRHV